MEWNVDYNHNTIVVDFEDDLFAEEKAEKLLKRFCDSWNSETDGLVYRLDLMSVFVCKNKFCVFIVPWKNGGISNCLDNFNQHLIDLSNGLIDWNS